MNGLNGVRARAVGLLGRLWLLGLAAALPSIVAIAAAGRIAASAPDETPATADGVVHAPTTKSVSFSILEDYDNGQDLAEVEADFRLMKELGIDTWRGSWGWDDYEPEPGLYDFEWLHAFAELADSYGIRLRPYVAYTAPWAAQGGMDDQYWNDPPADVEAWYRFVHALVSAMSVHANIASYELGNEQNVPLWWDGSREEFAVVLKRGAEAVRAADPDAEVVIGGLVWPEAEWMEEVCIDHGAASSFDIAAFHGYVETWLPPEQTVENFLDADYRDGYLATLRDACGEQPVWINELGFATTPGNSELDQADWWVRAVATFLAEPSVEHIGIYEIKDLPTDQPVIGDAVNHHLGLTYGDGRRKLAFHTVDLLVDLLNVGALAVEDADVSVRPVAGSADGVYHHLFRRPDGTRILFVWAREGRSVVEVELASRGAEVIAYALDGTSAPFEGFDGRVLHGVELEPGSARIFAVRTAPVGQAGDSSPHARDTNLHARSVRRYE